MKRQTTFTLDIDSLFPRLGSPVICHSLKNASHLNGKNGDIRGVDESSGRCAVHFEDGTTKPKLVKMENLRVVFDFPDECIENYDDVD